MTHKDLPLHADPSGRFLPWIIGLMIYLASLSISVGLSLNTLTHHWSQGLGNYLTLEMPPQGDAPDTHIETEFKVFQAAQSTPGLGSIKTLDLEKILNAFGTGTVVSDDLKILPKVLEIQITNRALFHFDAFKETLHAINPDLRIEDHVETKNTVRKIAQSTQMISFSIVSLIILATLSIIAFTSQTSLIIHRNIIEILYLVGATQSYIGKQFQSHAFQIGLRGSLLSLILGGITFVGVHLFGGDILFLSKVMQLHFLLPVFLITAAVITFFIMASARLTVKLALKNGFSTY
jgi:cell division transport system permease protein